MIHEQTVNTAQAHLTEQKSNLDELWSLLQTELSAVNERNGAALESLAKQKIIILNKVTQIDSALSALPITDIKQHNETVAEQITAISAQLEQCKQQNDVNAQAAHQTQLAVKKVTDVLIGSMKSITYDKKGYSQSGSLLGKGIKAQSPHQAISNKSPF